MMRHRYGHVWLGVVLTLVAGCGFTAPRVRYFEVQPTRGARQVGARLPAVMVPEFGCAPAYEHLRVVIRRSPVEVVTSRYLQWTTVPSRMLAQGLRDRLEATGRFEQVRRDASPPPRYIIDGFVQVIELEEEPRFGARLALHVSVRRSADGNVIEEDAIDVSQPADGTSPADGVLALRELYSRVLDGLIDKIIAAIEQDLRPAA